MVKMFHDRGTRAQQEAEEAAKLAEEGAKEGAAEGHRDSLSNKLLQVMSPRDEVPDGPDTMHGILELSEAAVQEHDLPPECFDRLKALRRQKIEKVDILFPILFLGRANGTLLSNSRIIPNHPESTRINPNQPKSTQINPNQPGAQLLGPAQGRAIFADNQGAQGPRAGYARGRLREALAPLGRVQFDSV